MECRGTSRCCASVEMQGNGRKRLAGVSRRNGKGFRPQGGVMLAPCQGEDGGKCSPKVSIGIFGLEL